MGFNRLESLKLGSTNLDLDKEDTSGVMMRMLNRVKDSLRTIDIHGFLFTQKGDDEVGLPTRGQRESTYFATFPEMPKVTRLSILSGNAYGLDILSLLRKLFNLEELDLWDIGSIGREVGVGQHTTFDIGIKGFLSYSSLREEGGHTKLRRLLCGVPFLHLRFLQPVVESFPNLTYLQMCLRKKPSEGVVNGQVQPQEETMTMSEAVCAISQLKGLERLMIDPEGRHYSKEDWITAFASLACFPKLNLFSYVCPSPKWPKKSSSSIWAEEAQLDNLKEGLRRLRGSKVTVRLLNVLHSEYRKELAEIGENIQVRAKRY